ncbi:MAG: hypothetical protein A3H97_22590 [Acidobacteria bacterium RIFCSPLOWO2_02_FULL_65_29]|nr:MAG: hypothetical protein A3H97_22590 [Acidobacteria bacterium RIFCSPLOWO2_02_FULL_65_29]
MSVPFRSARDHQAPLIGAPTALFSSRLYFSGEAPDLGAPYDVGDGGRRFLILETSRDVVEPLTIVLNWSRLLDSMVSR